VDAAAVATEQAVEGLAVAALRGRHQLRVVVGPVVDGQRVESFVSPRR
jgi:hypothetical protein